MNQVISVLNLPITNTGRKWGVSADIDTECTDKHYFKETSGSHFTSCAQSEDRTLCDNLLWATVGSDELPN